MQTANGSVTANSRELAILKKHFPQCFGKDGGAFDMEKFSELLSRNEVSIKKEGFSLNFLGKSYARYQANLDSETVIVPDAGNAGTDSGNVYIVGDNLDALQHLRHSYAEKVKCIYIDPPYNTGKDDFVYGDKFGFGARELQEKLGVDAEEAERICAMDGKCTHSAWLTFMYPRLALARGLLRDDGVIFISIDDNEQANLRRLCDEVFGEGNFLVNIVWEKRYTRSNNAKKFTTLTESILCYAKNAEIIQDIKEERNEKADSIYSNPDDDPRGVWTSVSYVNPASKDERPNLVYPLFNPFTKKEVEHPTNAWKYEKSTYEVHVRENKLYWGKNGENMYPRLKKFLSEMQGGMVPVDFWSYEDSGSTDLASKEVDSLIGRKIFDFPKPKELIQRMMTLRINGEIDKDFIILDFFSGSGTTAHAVMDLNARDGGNRKFIMVQLDEPVRKGSEAEKAGYATIDQIGRERIRRAAAKIKSENPGTTADLGFKTYYLKQMPRETLDKIKVFDPAALISADANIVKSLGEETVVQTWQVRDGFGFNTAAQKVDLAGCTAHLLDDGRIGRHLYLLRPMDDAAIKELVRRIESMELAADKVFVYGYSFDFTSLTALTTNLRTLKNRNGIEPIVRY